MPETILVVVEQREGKLNRVSWETVAAGQALAAETGWTLETAVVGLGVASIANEVASTKVSKVYSIESAALNPYTPDAFSAALKQFLDSQKPRIVLMPHTYQVRDFIPQLATAMQRTVISDCIGYRKDGDRLLFTRQMFQGKFAADVSFACDTPWFVTFQNGAFRGDKVESGASAAPVQTVNIEPFAISRRKYLKRQSRQLISRRRKSSFRLGAESKSRRTSNWLNNSPTRSEGKSPHHVPSATQAGCRWTGKSDRPARRSRRSFILRSVLVAPFSTLLE